MLLLYYFLVNSDHLCGDWYSCTKSLVCKFSHRARISIIEPLFNLSMKKITYGPNTLELYDSIHVIPPHRENEMSYYLLSDFGIGHTWQDINSHLGGVMLAAKANDANLLNQEVENLILGYLTMAGKYNPKHLAWICLVHSINGEPLTDLTEGNLQKVSQKLSEEGGIEYMWESVFDELKKKFPASWRYTFLGEVEVDPIDPSIFTDAIT